MSAYLRIVLVALFFSGLTAVSGQEQVFSGPQVGEKLPPFKVKGVFGDLADKDIELAGAPAENPVLLIFFHEKTRPAYGVMNMMMNYAATRKKDGLRSSVIYLTDDATETRVWLGRVKQNLNQNVVHAISASGLEGPGSYGLNRNVALTVLLAKEGKVTANFALVQPSVQSDGPKILKAIVDVTGGGKVPTIAELGGGRYSGQARMKADSKKSDAELVSLMRAVIAPQASEADVTKAIAAVEEYVSKNRAAHRDLAKRANMVVNSGKLSTYGTRTAQEFLKRWAMKYGAAVKRGDDSTEQSSKARTEK
ncbi:MAG: hypothetical protein GY758_10880 [Fuerstiella sp.]|nr:hypothetical protein [Fuerstiella sp.]MCP4513012.1 hypothetical protein [Fuerstiella sp.]